MYNIDFDNCLNYNYLSLILKINLFSLIRILHKRKKNTILERFGKIKAL